MITNKLSQKFEDLMNFNQVENLPARVFSLLIQSDNLHIDEEYQAISLINQYVKSVENHILEKRLDEEQNVQPQVEAMAE